MRQQRGLYPIGFFFLLVFCSSCLQDDELNLAFQSLKPNSMPDGIEVSSPTNENMDGVALENIYRDVYKDKNLWSLRSLLVFRNGSLVSEAYLKDESDRTQKHLIWSCTKQVMGILTGIAVDKGVIATIDDPISAYFDDELKNHTDKGSITIRNLLTMQSGIDYNNDGVDGQTDKILRQLPNNSLEFVLSLPLRAAQGTEFHYNDGNPHILSALLQKATGKPTDVWANEVLFSKIEMKNYRWVRYKDGVALGGFGIETTPRELAKIALCVADSGRWRGQQVVSAAWVKAMLSPQVQTKHPDFSFGYYWWIDAAKGAYFMWGHGGQFAFIVPEKKLVVVMTSIPNTQGEYEIQADEALPIVERIKNAAL